MKIILPRALLVEMFWGSAPEPPPEAPLVPEPEPPAPGLPPELATAFVDALWGAARASFFLAVVSRGFLSRDAFLGSLDGFYDALEPLRARGTTWGQALALFSPEALDTSSGTR